MKYRQHSKNIFISFLAIGLILSCQEIGEKEEINPIDEDMIAATLMADEYMNSVMGRASAERSITVLKFKDGEILFGTNSDDIKGYETVGEQTVTATVKPGEHVFWYAGGGLSDLDGIVFDESSMLKLVDAPEEAVYDKMWMLTIPEDFDEEDGMLKYDIVYDYKGNPGPPVVLDPKLKVGI